MVTGKAGTVVTVTMQLSQAAAKELKLSRTIVSKKVTLGTSGAALVPLKVTGKSLRELREHGHAQKVTVDAAGGGGTDTANGSLDL